jgi:AraC family transcriptional regulator
LLHIQENLDGDLTLQELAGVAHFSPFHFHRIFRGMVGESLHAHVRRIRLERAVMRLRYTNQPIIDIAFEARLRDTRGLHTGFSGYDRLFTIQYRKNNPKLFSSVF